MRPAGAGLDVPPAGAVVVKIIKVEKEIFIPPEGKILLHALSQAATFEPVQQQEAIETGFHEITVNQFDIEPVIIVITHHRLVQVALPLLEGDNHYRQVKEANAPFPIDQVAEYVLVVRVILDILCGQVVMVFFTVASGEG